MLESQSDQKKVSALISGPRVNFSVWDQSTHFVCSDPKFTPMYHIKKPQKIVADNKGNILLWTRNNQLHLTSEAKIIKTLPLEKETIKNIYANRLLFLILTVSGKVFFLTSMDRHILIPIVGTATGNYNKLQPVPFFNTSNLYVDSIAMGGWTNYYLCKGGQLYGNGLNSEGQLGTGSNISQQTPILLFENVSKVFSGNSSRSMFFIQNDKLFACGQEKDKKFGISSESRKNRKKLSHVDVFKDSKLKINGSDIKDLVSLSEATVFITNQGKIYSCGGQIQNGQEEDKDFFTEIKYFEDKTVVQIDSGYNYVLTLTSENEIYGWGTFSYHNQLSQNSDKKPAKIDLPYLNLSKPISFFCATDRCLIFHCNRFSSLEIDFKNLYESRQFTDYKLKHAYNENKISVHKFLIEFRTGRKISEIEKLNQTQIKKDDFVSFLKWIYYDDSSNLQSLKRIFNALNLSYPPKNKLKDDLLKLYKDEDSKDFNILVKDIDDDDDDDEDEDDENFIEIPVHKIVLLSRSGLFREMFKNIQKSTETNQVRDYSRKSIESLEILIKYFYTEKIELTADNDSQLIVEELEDAVEYYQLNKNCDLNVQLNKIKSEFNLN
ncbi:claret [Anaeramoeba flamelloides]|uniref:Claret n=1 Tax=Anaeramoeba flamelloides TaxID=1746091 RepID=A0ABQ8X4Z7_9EUKA|nr:claret [Anaeramoeba flamelloides]